MSAYPDTPLPDIAEIGLHQYQEGVPCYSCGDTTRNKQSEARNGYQGPHCCARWICQEEREANCPTCFYCGKLFVPKANRYCPDAPSIDGRQAHSDIEIKMDIPKEGEMKKNKLDHLFDQHMRDLEKKQKGSGYRSKEEQEFLHREAELRRLEMKEQEMFPYGKDDYYSQVPIISKGGPPKQPPDKLRLTENQKEFLKFLE